jgi:curved DNA-binding protein CbpA
MRTFYDILGVRKTDSPESVRAAYILLMKRHHPDAPGRTEAADAEVRLINEAFATLKDPRKRARYDAELGLATKRASAASAAAGRAASATPLKNPHLHRLHDLPARNMRPRRTRPRPLQTALFALLLIGASVGTVYAYRRLSEPELALSVGGDETHVAASPVPTDLPQVLRADVRDAVSDAQWIAAYGSPDDAIRYSRNCFAQLVDFPNLRFFDRCVTFDLAWRSRLQSRSTAHESYFSETEIAARHRSTLARFSEGEDEKDARLALLDRLTISEMARALSNRV